MAADPKLVVALEARLDKFEKQMRDAGLVAERGVRQINEKFAKVNPQVSFSQGIFQGIGQELARQAGKFVEKIFEASGELAKMARDARQIGLATDEFQALRFAGRVGGLSDEQFTKGLDSLAKKLNEAKDDESEIAKLFDANNLKLKDRAGTVISINRALEQGAELIRRAATEQDKIKIAELLGLSREWVPVLEKGADAFKQLASQASELGLIIDRETIQRAEEFDKKWKSASTAFQISMKAAITQIIADFGPLIGLIGTVLGGAQKLLALVGRGAKEGSALIGALTGTETVEQLEEQVRRLQPNANGINIPGREQALADAQRKLDEALERQRERSRGRALSDLGPRTVIPQKDEGGGGGGKDSFERQVESIQKHIAAMEADAEAVGKGAGEQARLRTEAALTEALLRAGIEINDDYADKITKVANAAGAAADALEKVKSRAPLAEFARDAQNLDKQLSSAALSAFRSFEDGFADFVLGTKSAAAAFHDMAQSIIRDLIKIAVRQAITGPLAGALFGFMGGNSAGSGAFELATGFAGARAGGGSVSAGKSYLVGEHGPEIFQPGRSGVIQPNSITRSIGGSSFTYAPVIDARGADAAAVARLERVVQAQAQQLKVNSRAMANARHFNNTGVTLS